MITAVFIANQFKRQLQASKRWWIHLNHCWHTHLPLLIFTSSMQQVTRFKLHTCYSNEFIFFNLYFNLKINEETFQVDSLPHMIQNPIQILINSLEIETKFWILKTLSDIHLINENNYCKYSGRIMCATYSASKRLNSSQVPVSCLVDWMLTYQWSTWPMISDHSLLGKYINGFRM